MEGGANNELKNQFLAIGLDPGRIESLLKNKKACGKLKEIIEAAGVAECEKSKGNLLDYLAGKLPDRISGRSKLICTFIMEGKLTKTAQVQEAIDYLSNLAQTKGVEHDIDLEEFANVCGVGVVVTEDDILKAVNEAFEESKEELLAKKYDFQFNTILYKVKEKVKWADQKLVIETINKKKVEWLGEAPTDEGGRKKKGKQTKEDKEEKKKEEVKEESSAGKRLTDLMGGRLLASTGNSAEILKKHNEFTQGRVVTRFPPEPNGYLHIGHAKAMRFNFTIAKENNGITYLRYDDTNPLKENQEFIDKTKEAVEWLGYQPWKITFSSDYFQELYEMAIELIKKGKAFVCHQTVEEMRDARGKKENSPFRERTVEENLALFQRMKEGRCNENECCLRMKIDMTHENPCMRDPVAYRIRYVTHPHAGDGWCIYPTYDYTHCLVDSIENITHSLCSLEFEIRRESYYWLLEALDIYRPVVWEYSRLNISYNVLSKRKLEKLVKEKAVEGWDDPRLMTLMGLKRRGYTPSMINEFAHEIGVARKGNENVTSIKLLEYFARKELDANAARTFGVLDPILVKISNFEEVKEREIDAPLFPTDKSRGFQKYYLDPEIYIESDDFSEVHKEGFFGLTPSQPVSLKYGVVIAFQEAVKDASGKLLFVQATVLPNFEKKLKGHIHWVAKSHAVEAEVRLYNYLFTVPEVGDDWYDRLNPESRIVKKGAKVWDSIGESKEDDRFQFERIGYFVVDKDSRMEKVNGKLVFNRVVELKESKEKKVNQGKA